MSYAGAKGQAGVFQRIIGQMPPHSEYIEPFFGSGRIFREKRLALTNWLNDLDFSVFSRHGITDTEPFELIHSVSLYSENATDLILSLVKVPRPSTLIYCDPPYILETRRNRRYYAHEMTLADHERLLDVLLKLKCMVMISGYPHELYGRKLQDWRCISYRTRTRGRTVTECLWCNFPEPTELHDWRFAGRNYRERLSFKRLAARSVARILAMPDRKRGFVLEAIKAQFNLQ